MACPVCCVATVTRVQYQACDHRSHHHHLKCSHDHGHVRGHNPDEGPELSIIIIIIIVIIIIIIITIIIHLSVLIVTIPVPRDYLRHSLVLVTVASVELATLAEIGFVVRNTMSTAPATHSSLELHRQKH